MFVCFLFFLFVCLFVFILLLLLKKSFNNFVLQGPNVLWVSAGKILSFSVTSFSHSRLSLSRCPRDSLKNFEISVHRHIRFCRIEEKINRTTIFYK